MPNPRRNSLRVKPFLVELKKILLAKLRSFLRGEEAIQAGSAGQGQE
jgi:hypothetical protein